MLLTQSHRQAGRASEASGARTVSAADLAITRSQNYLLSIQNPEGYWVVWGELLLHAIHGRVLDHIKNLSEHNPSGHTAASAP